MDDDEEREELWAEYLRLTVEMRRQARKLGLDWEVEEERRREGRP